MKKAVTSSFSLRLHSYVEKKATTGKYGGWAYRLPDIDHSGTHSARLVATQVMFSFLIYSKRTEVFAHHNSHVY